MDSTVHCAQHLLPERISVLFCQKKLLIFEQPSLLVISTAAVADYHIKVTIFFLLRKIKISELPAGDQW